MNSVNSSSSRSPTSASASGFQSLVRWKYERIPDAIAGLLVLSVVMVGLRTNWQVGKFSDLLGRKPPSEQEWCATHSVNESICVECGEQPPEHTSELYWCSRHGIHQCPHCQPEFAQLVELPATNVGLALNDPIPETMNIPDNNSRCRLHLRRIQFNSLQSLRESGIETSPVRIGPISESISATGELVFDPTRVARISARSSGILWSKLKNVGDAVDASELIAIVDSLSAGKAKAEYQQAITNLELKTFSLARRKPLEGSSLAGSDILAAELDAAEAQIRVLASRQNLMNLGLPVHTLNLASATPAEITDRLRLVGFSGTQATDLLKKTRSNSLLPVRAPFAGVVLEAESVPGESVDEHTVLYVIANTQHVWLTLHVPIEHAQRVRVGQDVQFQHAGHRDWDTGKVARIGLSVNPANGAILVYVELAHSTGEHAARIAGKARILVRNEPKAVVVPSSAVHWEGDCHVVFVRDKYFDVPEAPKVFHVRKIRPGVQDVVGGIAMTEVVAGLLPGETIATTNSGILRAELLKNNLGVG